MILLLLAALAAAAPAKAPDARAVFEESVGAWETRRALMHERMLKLRAELKGRPEARDAALALWGKWRREEKLRAELHRKLVLNQEEAAKAGLLTPEQLERHRGKLSRLLREKLLWLWGSAAPRELNETLKKMKASRTPGYPFPSYPSAAEYEALRSKDFVPVYEDGALRTVK